MVTDSFDLWGASLCWADEDVPPSRVEPGGPEPDSTKATAQSPRQSSLDRQVKKINEEVEELEAKIEKEEFKAVPGGHFVLSTQDIEAHEASFDCGAVAASVEVNACHEDSMTSGCPVRAATFASASQSVEDLQRSASDDTQVYVTPSSGPGLPECLQELQTLPYTHVALPARGPEADTVQYEIALELDMPEQKTAICSDTLQYEAHDFLFASSEKPVETIQYVSNSCPQGRMGLDTLQYEGWDCRADFKVLHPVATPVRNCDSGKSAWPYPEEAPGNTEASSGLLASGELHGSQGRRVQAEIEDSSWLVPVKRRRVERPAHRCAAAGVQEDKLPRKGKPFPATQDEEPPPASKLSASQRSQAVARRQLTLAEAFEQSAPTWRDCPCVDSE
mmetsp:Transcript_12117/g.22849  ORF Transcript_12117/g.22849 Transcript_12117/m.22849 type:complete len:391 (-) Transcript_12117:160-1332(-)